MSLLLHQRRPGTPVVPLDPAGLAGVGSASDSYTLYPPTAPTTIGDWYVDAQAGNDSNTGTSMGQAFRTIQRALSVVQDGQTILARGNFSLSTLTRGVNWTTGIRIMGYGHEVPRLDFGGASYGLHLNGRREHWCGFHIVNANTYGIRVYGGIFNRLERMYVSDCARNEYGAGIIVNGPPADDNLIIDCAAWRLGTPGMSGSNTPDGIVFTAASGSLGYRNRVVRCFVANATDDAFDFYRCSDGEGLDLVALASGYFYNGNTSSSEGHGLKMGGGGGSGNQARGVIAVHCRRTGLNSNGAANVHYERCTSYGNNYGVEFRNGASGYAEEVLAVGNSTNVPVNQYNSLPPSGSLVRNSWQSGVTAANVHFADPAGGDFSLLPASAAATAGLGGAAIGASVVALDILKRWWNHSQVWIPGRGYGPGGTGLPGDT